MDKMFSFKFMSTSSMLEEEIDDEQNKPQIDVVSFTGTEGISELYKFDITLAVSNLKDLTVTDFANKLLCNRVVFTLQNAEELSRDICGIINEVQLLGQFGEKFFYKIALVPEVSNLLLVKKTRVFTGLSAAQIIANILAENIPGSGRLLVSMAGIQMSNYQPEEFVMQYNESNWEFVSRLMERVGIYYYFEHPVQNHSQFNGLDLGTLSGNQQEILVLLDNKHYQGTMKPEALFWNNTGTQSKNNVYNLQVGFKRKSLAVEIRGYDLDKNRTISALPKAMTALVHSEKGDEVLKNVNNGTNQMYSAILNSDNAELYSKVNAERENVGGEFVTGTSTCATMSSGNIFRMLGAQWFENRKLLTVKIEHEGAQAGYEYAGLIADKNNINKNESFYENKFYAIPSDIQYRAPLKTAIPKVGGFLPAIVESQTGSNSGLSLACMDDLGRYKIKFGFDDETKNLGYGSGWVKLLQPFGGTDAKSGMHFPLLGGAQVLVGFIDGNVDLPYIVGSVQDQSGSVVTSANQICNVIKSGTGTLLVMGDSIEPGKNYVLYRSDIGFSAMGPAPESVVKM